MSAAGFLEFAIDLGILLLAFAFALVIVRIARGPTLPDRVLGLDLLVTLGIGFIAVIGMKTGFYLYVDIAIALGLVGFLATVALARYLMARGEREAGHTAPPTATPAPEERR